MSHGSASACTACWCFFTGGQMSASSRRRLFLSHEKTERRCLSARCRTRSRCLSGRADRRYTSSARHSSRRWRRLRTGSTTSRYRCTKTERRRKRPGGESLTTTWSTPSATSALPADPSASMPWQATRTDRIRLTATSSSPTRCTLTSGQSSTTSSKRQRRPIQTSW